MAQLECQGGGWWRIVVSYQRRRWVRALDTQDEKEAQSIKFQVEQTLKLIKRGIIDFHPGDDLLTVLLSSGRLRNHPKVHRAVTLGEMIDIFLANRTDAGREQNSRNTESLHLSHVVRILGKRLLITDVEKNLQRYIDTRAKEGTTAADRKKRSRRSSIEDNRVSRDTIRRELTTLGTVWNRWALRQGLVQAVLVLRDLRFPKSRPKPPFQTWEQVERKVAAGASEDLWDSVFLDTKQIRELVNFVQARGDPLATAMFAFVGYTGARRAEMRRARVEDFELIGNDPHVLIREKKKDRTKSVTFRKVSLPRKLVMVMREWLGGPFGKGQHPGGPMAFCRCVRGRHGASIGLPVALTEKMAYLEFRNAVAGSKWDKLKGWHCLRHSVISNLASRGEPERVIMEIAGPLDEDTSRRYQHLFPNVVKETMRRVFDEMYDDGPDDIDAEQNPMDG